MLLAPTTQRARFAPGGPTSSMVIEPTPKGRLQSVNEVQVSRAALQALIVERAEQVTAFLRAHPQLRAFDCAGTARAHRKRPSSTRSRGQPCAARASRPRLWSRHASLTLRRDRAISLGYGAGTAMLLNHTPRPSATRSRLPWPNCPTRIGSGPSTPTGRSSWPCGRPSQWPHPRGGRNSVGSWSNRSSWTTEK